MLAKIVRNIFIAIGLSLMVTEMYLAGIGAFKVNTALYYAIPMAGVAILMIAGEAISLHYAHVYKVRREYGNVTIAVALWGLAFIVGTFFTIAGVNVRSEQNTATRVAGFLKHSTQESTEKELTRDIGLLTDQIASLQTALIVDGGGPRKVRPIAAIEADGRFLKSERCGAINPANTGQRTVCQEYATAKDLHDKERQLVIKRAKLDAAREKLTTGDVVLSRSTGDTAVFASMGLDPESAMIVVSLFIGVTLHVFSSLIWFVVPKMAVASAPGGSGAPKSPQPPTRTLALDEALRRWATGEHGQKLTDDRPRPN
jgi:hypothetical protein